MLRNPDRTSLYPFIMQPSSKPFEATHEPLDNCSFSRREWLRATSLGTFLPLIAPWSRAAEAAEPDRVQALVLSYSRFARTGAGNQVVSEATFKEHVKAIEDSGATVIKLADLVLHKRNLLVHLPAKPVVLTFEGAERSAMDIALRAITVQKWPLTMFIEPSKVGTAKSMLTWDELISLHHGDRFSMQSTGTPLVDLVKARKKRSVEVLEGLFNEHIGKARTTVETRLVKPVSFVSWPYGAYDSDMLALARKAGLLGGVATGNRVCRRSDSEFAIPRFEMRDDFKGADLAKLIQESWPAQAAQRQG
jgi:Polysaccharide deacetylase